MKIDNAIVGVNLSTSDKFLCEYVDFLATKLPIETVHNLYVFTARGAFNAMLKSAGKKEAKALLDTFKEKMEATISPLYHTVKNINNHAIAGLFIETFFHLYDRTKTELIVLGKKPESDGTMNKFIVRHVPSHTLIVPEGVKHRLNNVVIALNQAQSSVKLLRNALDFCSLFEEPPTITCLYVDSAPSHGELADLFDEIHQNKVYEFKKMYERYLIDLQKNFENFVRKNSADYSHLKINTMVVRESRKSYHGLLDYLNADKADMLILGTKSHSILDTMLLGSFTEKIITKNNKIPMLVVK